MTIRRLYLSLFIALCISIPLRGQPESIEAIERAVQLPDVKMHIHFLAADEFKGRDTGTPHLDIAGRYIATWFMTNGIKPMPGQEDYYQPIPFIEIKPPDDGEIALGDSTYTIAEDFIILNSPRGEFNGPIKVLEYGMEDELEGRELEGNVVVTKAGAQGQVAPQQWFRNTDQKHRILRERGAAAVIELYDSRQIPWPLIVNILNEELLTVDEREEEENGEMPHLWLNSTGRDLHSAFAAMQSDDASISVTGEVSEGITSNNVVGYIEGTDPELREEYLLLGAHYDHIGIDEERKGEENYIYNGARDNAVGTSAILLAARYLAENPPKRSVIFAAWTAEEIGLFGSNYFAENPPVPLEQIIYNLNIDGAGYNDTTKVTVIGLERTEAEDDLRAAAAAFGLEAIPDPVPEQNLFDRSDNVSFASRGVPAPTYSLGIIAFDEEIEKYYHTVQDEPHTLNYPYITQYIRSFLLAAEKVANSEVAPFWREGDTYEEAGLELYGLEPTGAE